MSAEVVPFRGKLAGQPGSIADYSVREDASPLHLNDLSAGVGSIDVPALNAKGRSGSLLLPGQRFSLQDEFSGGTTGIVDGLTISDGFATVTASGGLGALVADKTIPAMDDRLYAVVQAIMAQAQVGSQIGPMPASDPEYSAALLDQNVCVPASTGEVWQFIKRLAAIYGFDIGVVGDFTYIRPRGKRTIETSRNSQASISVDVADQARDVVVHYYNNQWVDSAPTYPTPGTSIINMEMLSVEPSETVTQNYPVNMWLSTVNQPEHQLTVPVDFQPGAMGVYSVINGENIRIDPTVWRNAGGSLSVAIGADGKSIDVTVTGMSATQPGPYRIAATTADGEYQYGSLYISATGIKFEDKKVTVRTGADEVDLPADSVIEIDDPAVNTREQAMEQAVLIAMDAAGSSQSVQVTASYVTAQGATGEAGGLSFDEASTAEAWEDLTFDAYFAVDETFDEWTTGLEFAHSPIADRQTFGNVAGSRARIEDAYYRVATASMGPGSVSWSGKEDTTFEDWAEVYEPSDLTFDQYGTIWDDLTFDEMGRQPLLF